MFTIWQSCSGRCGFMNGSLQLSRRNQILMAGQPYTVSLLLQMPESPINRYFHLHMYVFALVCPFPIRIESKIH
jgi:hypothetical protein